MKNALGKMISSSQIIRGLILKYKELLQKLEKKDTTQVTQENKWLKHMNGKLTEG